MSGREAAIVEGARASLGRNGRTFALASLALPASTRDDAAVLYAFCRAADDAVDERADAAELDGLRAEIVGAAPMRPLVARLSAVMQRHRMPVGAALHLLDGIATDAGPVRIADEQALVRYAFAVAGTVGQLMAPLLGASDPCAAQHAVWLGIAMQLTNIARDVGEDARRGRVYLPATWLAAEGVTADDVLAGRSPAAVQRVVRHLLQVADGYYARGEAGIVYLPLRSRVTVAIAARVYRAIGNVVLRRGVRALRERAIVGPFERLWHAMAGLRAGLRAKPPRGLPWATA